SSVANSRKSHGVKIGIVFLGVTSLAFYWLVYYGVEAIKDRTISYMPPELARQVSTVQLEIFEVVFLVVKYSLIAGVVAVVPMIIYYSWDALVKESVIEGGGSVFFYVSRVGVVVGLFV
ncbi:MAG: twin-arginine translocase subunit TatC, partial [Halobacteria archaeon]|nr:twin-arginine translocase subunit TatC [Halobacteria archaeon]